MELSWRPVRRGLVIYSLGRLSLATSLGFAILTRRDILGSMIVASTRVCEARVTCWALAYRAPCFLARYAAGQQTDQFHAAQGGFIRTGTGTELTLRSGLAQGGLVSRAKQVEAAATESTLHSQREQRPAGQGLLGFRCTFRRTV